MLFEVSTPFFSTSKSVCLLPFALSMSEISFPLLILLPSELDKSPFDSALLAESTAFVLLFCVPSPVYSDFFVSAEVSIVV